MGKGLRSAGPQSGALRLHCCRQPTTPISYLVGLPDLPLRWDFLAYRGRVVHSSPCAPTTFSSGLSSHVTMWIWGSLSPSPCRLRDRGEQLYLMFPSVCRACTHGIAMMFGKWMKEQLVHLEVTSCSISQTRIANYHVEDGKALCHAVWCRVKYSYAWLKTVVSFLDLCGSSRLNKKHIVLGDRYSRAGSAKFKNEWELRMLVTLTGSHIWTLFSHPLSLWSSQKPWEMGRLFHFVGKESKTDWLTDASLSSKFKHDFLDQLGVFPANHLLPRWQPNCLNSQQSFRISDPKRRKMYSMQWRSKIKELKGCLSTLQILSFRILVVAFQDSLMDMLFTCVHNAPPLLALWIIL